MYDNEQDVLQKLGIPSWRHLSKDKFMDFIAVMPEMSNEVRLKIIEQIPQFAKLCTEGLDAAKEAILKIVDKNEVTTAAIINLIDLIRENIAQGLNREGISFEERKFLIEKLMELAKMYNGMDARSKKFFETIYGKLITGITIFLGTIVVLVGGKVLLSSKEDADKS